MTDPAAVDRYLDALLVEQDAVLEAALAEAVARGLPAHPVSPSQGKFLSVLARAVGAARILELGTLAGYSAIWLGRALPPGGRVVTLELDPDYARVAVETLARAGLSDAVEVVVGDAADTLARLVADGTQPFDLIFIDADKARNDVYLPLCLDLARPGTVIVADNVVRDGAVADPASEDASAQGVRRFLDMVSEEPRLAASALQTVGAKGWDGFVLALVSA